MSFVKIIICKNYSSIHSKKNTQYPKFCLIQIRLSLFQSKTFNVTNNETCCKIFPKLQIVLEISALYKIWTIPGRDNDLRTNEKKTPFW